MYVLVAVSMNEDRPDQFFQMDENKGASWTYDIEEATKTNYPTCCRYKRNYKHLLVAFEFKILSIGGPYFIGQNICIG